MKEMTVRFNNLDDVIKFVDIVETYPGLVVLECEDYTVDGKSMIGIINYCLNKDVRMIVYGSEHSTILQQTAFCKKPA